MFCMMNEGNNSACWENEKKWGLLKFRTNIFIFKSVENKCWFEFFSCSPEQIFCPADSWGATVHPVSVTVFVSFPTTTIYVSNAQVLGKPRTLDYYLNSTRLNLLGDYWIQQSHNIFLSLTVVLSGDRVDWRDEGHHVEYSFRGLFQTTALTLIF